MLGDSSAQGIGAESPEKGYVGLIEDYLRPIITLNVSESAATVHDMPRQLNSALAWLKFSLNSSERYNPCCVVNGGTPIYVCVGIGSVDVSHLLTYNQMKFRHEWRLFLQALLATFGPGAPHFASDVYNADVHITVGELPFFSGGARPLHALLPFLFPDYDPYVCQANLIIHEEVDRVNRQAALNRCDHARSIPHGSFSRQSHLCIRRQHAAFITVAPLYTFTRANNTSPWKFAADYFHPNDQGYRSWAAAFLEGLFPKRIELEYNQP